MSIDGEPNMSEVLEAVITAAGREIHAIMPGLVTSADMSTGRVSAQPGVGSDPVIPDVPLLFHGTAKTGLTFPVASDDQVLLLHGDRNLDGWIAGDGAKAQTTTDPRTHDLSDALALPVGIKPPERETDVNLYFENATGGPSGATEIVLQPGDATETPGTGVSPGTAKVAIGGVVSGTVEQYSGDPDKAVSGTVELFELLVQFLDMLVGDTPPPMNQARVGGATPIMMTKAAANITGEIRDKLKMIQGSM
jgi:hypothetical protein